MPLYEYQCECGERSEILQKFSDPVTSECPKCGKDMRRLMSAPAIQFKGSGFYKTDYAKTSSSPAGSSTKSDGAKSESSSSDSSSSKSDSKSESTPAAAPAKSESSSKAD